MAVRPKENPFEAFLARFEDDPVAFVREVLGGDPDVHQAAVLMDIAAGQAKQRPMDPTCQRITVRSGHGVGKSTLLAWAIVWFSVTRFPQKTLCTAPTSSQLFDALAAETKAWFRKLPETIRELFEIKTDRIELRAAPDESFVTFATSRAETPEALAGKHSKQMLIIADEASGVPEQVYEAARGSLAGDRRTFIMTGNPVRRQGLFYESHTNLALGWKRHHISCVNHPRIPASFAQSFADQYGEESNAFRVRVLGEFPRVDDDAIIPFEWLEAAATRDVVAYPTARPVWGLDVGRKGSDPSALAKRKGNLLTEPVKLYRGLDLMDLVGRIKAEFDATLPSERPEVIYVDTIGMGAGVYDRGKELRLPMRGINVSESPSLTDQYLNLRTELWFKGRAYFERRDCRVSDKDLLAELGALTYKYSSSGKRQAEAKDDLKKRLPRMGSPNRADAFLLTLAGHAVVAAGLGDRRAWAQPIRRNIPGLL